MIILKELILSGKTPQKFDISTYIQNNDENHPEKGITRSEIGQMMSKLGDSWENIHIGDNRNINIEIPDNINKEQYILKVIGKVPNPVVRHRILWFYNELKKISKKHGEPDEVIIEFIRDSEKDTLFGKAISDKIIKAISENEKQNKIISKELEIAGLSEKNNHIKLKLLKQQGSKCIYTEGTTLGLSDLENCQIDHIVPISKGGNDALTNKVLCLSTANQQKGDRTPYEWFMQDKPNEWEVYFSRIMGLKKV